MGGRRVWIIALAGTLVASLTSYLAAWAYLEKHPGAFGDAFEIREIAPENEWSSIRHKHWQLVSNENEAPAETDAREGTRGDCAPGMVEVRGAAKVDPPYVAFGNDIESLQDRTCSEWIAKDFPSRCGKFDREKWLPLLADVPVRAMNFCIDRFEYPSRKGQNPMVVVTWTEAKALCENDGKRLCSEAEWTFACEGEEASPYPNGYERDETACVMDRVWRPFSQAAMNPRDGEVAKLEMDRLWQGEPSGSRAKCRSAFGVYDLTGNVDEWTTSTQTSGFSSVLKGGYWGQVRARCRPATRAHDETFVAYQQGFRCCSGAPVPADDAGGVADDSGVESDAAAPLRDVSPPTVSGSELPDEERAIAARGRTPVFTCAPLFGRFVSTKKALGASAFFVFAFRGRRKRRS